MAKAINLSSTKEKEIILKTSSSIISSLSDRKYKLKIMEDEWGDEVVRNNSYDKDLFIYCTYSSNIPAIGKRCIDYIIYKFADEMGLQYNSKTIFSLLVTCWFIINEIISILENTGRMGVELPKFLKNTLVEMKKDIDNN